MKSDTIRLVVVRPCLIDGRPQPVGTKLDLQPQAALDAVESGRIGFVDERDRARCMEARRAEIAKQLRHFAAPDPGYPWQPSRYQ
jgi:hypothetical protein